jgi:hypothetical protein
MVLCSTAESRTVYVGYRRTFRPQNYFQNRGFRSFDNARRIARLQTDPGRWLMDPASTRENALAKYNIILNYKNLPSLFALDDPCRQREHLNARGLADVRYRSFF